jgi:predicted enzyme related to lactoylglutathione lyase
MVAAAVVYVKDLPRMRTFYEKCFSLAAAAPANDEFCVLTSVDWELSLVAVPEAVAVKLVVSDPPERRTETPLKLAFDVGSIEELRPILMVHGGQPGPAESAWEFRGHWYLDCLDPEGNVVQLRQPVTEGQA